MDGVLAILLCLQGSLLVIPSDCSDKGISRSAEQNHLDTTHEQLLDYENKITKTTFVTFLDQKPSEPFSDSERAQLVRRKRQNVPVKNKSQKPRTGVFSTLSITLSEEKKAPSSQPAALSQRSRRQVQNNKKVPKRPSRPGGYSPLGRPGPPPQGSRVKRNLMAKKKKIKTIVC